jgi:hypothetical protein
MNDMAPDLTAFVWTFLAIDVLAALVVVGVVVGALAHHHGQRVRRRETIRRYYGHLATGRLALGH